MGLRLVDLLTQFETEPHAIPNSFYQLVSFEKETKLFYSGFFFFIGFF